MLLMKQHDRDGNGKDEEPAGQVSYKNQTEYWQDNIKNDAQVLKLKLFEFAEPFIEFGLPYFPECAHAFTAIRMMVRDCCL